MAADVASPAGDQYGFRHGARLLPWSGALNFLCHKDSIARRGRDPLRRSGLFASMAHLKPVHAGTRDFRALMGDDMATIRKVVLAYSGGLDTSVILKWLREHYHCEVVTFTADLGQGEELAPASAKAALLGVKEIFIDDLREEFVRDFVYPMFRANTLYEGERALMISPIAWRRALRRPSISPKRRRQRRLSDGSSTTTQRRITGPCFCAPAD